MTRYNYAKFNRGQTNMGFRTRQIHAGVTPDPITGSILTPIYQSTTYVQPSVDEYLSKGFTYSRSASSGDSMQRRT